MKGNSRVPALGEYGTVCIKIPVLALRKLDEIAARLKINRTELIRQGVDIVGFLDAGRVGVLGVKADLEGVKVERLVRDAVDGLICYEGAK